MHVLLDGQDCIKEWMKFAKIPVTYTPSIKFMQYQKVVFNHHQNMGYFAFPFEGGRMKAFQGPKPDKAVRLHHRNAVITSWCKVGKTS